MYEGKRKRKVLALARHAVQTAARKTSFFGAEQKRQSDSMMRYK
jgi:hypothetical protein